MSEDTTTFESVRTGDKESPFAEACEALVVVWCKNERSRVGETLLVPRGDLRTRYVFGRGSDDHARGERATLWRQRPGDNARMAPLETPHISRGQLLLWPSRGGGLEIESIGKRTLRIAGKRVAAGRAMPGDLVEIGGQLLLYCTRRPETLPAMRAPDPRWLGPFGEADAFGYVGESPVAWRLRDEVGLAALQPEHVLVLGESGTGKELVAQAIHALGPRAKRRLVARNAATVPSGILDAEIFGSAANYPNAGMAERPGLVGEADGGALYLDEIGELPAELQTHFLRVLDGGDYQRLGDARKRTVDLRVIAATNRPLGHLRSDMSARFPLRLSIPGLHERREDIPLLVRHLLQRNAKRAGASRAGGVIPEPSIELSAALISHTYTTNVREIVSVLLQAMIDDGGSVLPLTAGAAAALASARPSPAEAAPELTREAILQALEKNGGQREKTWRELGLASRYVLKRLMKKHGIERGEE